MPQLSNFPHQYNDLRKLRRTLEIHDGLFRSGVNTSDDAEFGYALAEARVYHFRDTTGMTAVDYEAADSVLTQKVRTRVAEERRKPASSQGARTAAREMRKTMQYLQWIDGSGQLTAIGTALLAAAPESDAELDVFRRALLDLVVTGPAGSFHPVRLLLKLVDDGRLTSRAGMELALAARDDSIESYRELLSLAGLPEAERRTRLGATDFQMKNAVKILPSFALQTALIAQAADGVYFLTPGGRAALNAYAAGGQVSVLGNGGTATERGGLRRRTAQQRPRRTATRRTSAEALGRQYENAGQRRNLTDEEQEAAARLLLERTTRHQELVRAVGALGGSAELHENEAAFDLLYVPGTGSPLVLWEIKTVDFDDVAQVRRASEQLVYYDYFYVRPVWIGREVLRAALFESRPGDELCTYLQDEHDIAAFTLEEGELVPLNTKATDTLLVIRKFGGASAA